MCLRSGIRCSIIGMYDKLSNVIMKLLVIGLKFGIHTRLLNSYHPIPELGIRIATHREQAVIERWQAISSEISATPACVMDIGCNLGFYCIESAKLGHLAIGIDMPNYARALMIIRGALALPNVVPIGIQLSPDNVSILPCADYLIVLQVFHHMRIAYGIEKALEIVRVLYGKCDRKLFFESESDVRITIDKNQETGRQNLVDIFHALGCKNVREIYHDHRRSRSVLVVEK